jgi:hypothetical protein
MTALAAVIALSSGFSGNLFAENGAAAPAAAPVPMQAPMPRPAYGPGPGYGGGPWGGGPWGGRGWNNGPWGGGPWGGNRGWNNGPWNSGPWGGNNNWMPWGNMNNWGRGSRYPFGSGPQGWMQPNDPKGSMSRMWDDMLNAPSNMGTMPGGWKAPTISVPNPVDVGDEFGDAMQDLPNQMDNFRANY